MFGECHAHLIMDGLNYKDAISIHKDHVNDESDTETFESL